MDTVITEDLSLKNLTSVDTRRQVLELNRLVQIQPDTLLEGNELKSKREELSRLYATPETEATIETREVQLNQIFRSQIGNEISATFAGIVLPKNIEAVKNCKTVQEAKDLLTKEKRLKSLEIGKDLWDFATQTEVGFNAKDNLKNIGSLVGKVFKTGLSALSDVSRIAGESLSKAQGGVRDNIFNPNLSGSGKLISEFNKGIGSDNYLTNLTNGFFDKSKLVKEKPFSSKELKTKIETHLSELTNRKIQELVPQNLSSENKQAYINFIQLLVSDLKEKLIDQIDAQEALQKQGDNRMSLSQIIAQNKLNGAVATGMRLLNSGATAGLLISSGGGALPYALALNNAAGVAIGELDAYNKAYIESINKDIKDYQTLLLGTEQNGILYQIQNTILSGNISKPQLNNVLQILNNLKLTNDLEGKKVLGDTGSLLLKNLIQQIGELEGSNLIGGENLELNSLLEKISEGQTNLSEWKTQYTNFNSPTSSKKEKQLAVEFINANQAKAVQESYKATIKVKASEKFKMFANKNGEIEIPQWALRALGHTARGLSSWLKVSWAAETLGLTPQEYLNSSTESVAEGISKLTDNIAHQADQAALTITSGIQDIPIKVQDFVDNTGLMVEGGLRDLDFYLTDGQISKFLVNNLSFLKIPEATFTKIHITGLSEKALLTTSHLSIEGKNRLIQDGFVEHFIDNGSSIWTKGEVVLPADINQKLANYLPDTIKSLNLSHNPTEWKDSSTLLITPDSIKENSLNIGGELVGKGESGVVYKTFVKLPNGESSLQYIVVDGKTTDGKLITHILGKGVNTETLAEAGDLWSAEDVAQRLVFSKPSLMNSALGREINDFITVPDGANPNYALSQSFYRAIVANDPNISQAKAQNVANDLANAVRIRTEVIRRDDNIREFLREYRGDTKLGNQVHNILNKEFPNSNLTESWNKIFSGAPDPEIAVEPDQYLRTLNRFSHSGRDFGAWFETVPGNLKAGVGDGRGLFAVSILFAGGWGFSRGISGQPLDFKMNRKRKDGTSEEVNGNIVQTVLAGQAGIAVLVWLCGGGFNLFTLAAIGGVSLGALFAAERVGMGMRPGDIAARSLAEEASKRAKEYQENLTAVEAQANKHYVEMLEELHTLDKIRAHAEGEQTIQEENPKSRTAATVRTSYSEEPQTGPTGSYSVVGRTMPFRSSTDTTTPSSPTATTTASASTATFSAQTETISGIDDFSVEEENKTQANTKRREILQNTKELREQARKFEIAITKFALQNPTKSSKKYREFSDSQITAMGLNDVQKQIINSELEKFLEKKRNHEIFQIERSQQNMSPLQTYEAIFGKVEEKNKDKFIKIYKTNLPAVVMMVDESLMPKAHVNDAAVMMNELPNKKGLQGQVVLVNAKYFDTNDINKVKLKTLVSHELFGHFKQDISSVAQASLDGTEKANSEKIEIKKAKMERFLYNQVGRELSGNLMEGHSIDTIYKKLSTNNQNQDGNYNLKNTLLAQLARNGYSSSEIENLFPKNFWATFEKDLLDNIKLIAYLKEKNYTKYEINSLLIRSINQPISSTVSNIGFTNRFYRNAKWDLGLSQTWLSFKKDVTEKEFLERTVQKSPLESLKTKSRVGLNNSASTGVESEYESPDFVFPNTSKTQKQIASERVNARQQREESRLNTNAASKQQLEELTSTLGKALNGLGQFAKDRIAEKLGGSKVPNNPYGKESSTVTEYKDDEY